MIYGVHLIVLWVNLSRYEKSASHPLKKHSRNASLCKQIRYMTDLTFNKLCWKMSQFLSLMMLSVSFGV